ncbi:protease modulator HflC [bacterium]|nr:protease modulator HflC [bacterium]
MKAVATLIVLIVALLVLLILGGAFYIVDEREQVIITQFGRPVGEPISTPGLKFKVPFLQKRHSFDKRFLEWDGDRNQLPTKDKRFIDVDTYARWRISDPLRFFQRLRDVRSAQSRLDDILDGETRNTIARHDLIEVVRNSNREFLNSREAGEGEDTEVVNIKFGRDFLAQEVLSASQPRVSDFGIEVLDFRFKRLNYVPEVRREVYARMISERQRIAEQFRSEGEGEAARINGERERELLRIRSEAYREAEEIRGRADGEAADIYAKAYNRDPEFYRFIKTMEVYGVTLDADTVLLLGTDGDFLRYLEKAK